MELQLKTILTNYSKYCVICGKPAEMHHIFKGNKQRKLADEDSLIIPLCQEHHRGNMSVHMKKEMNVLCEIAGQLAWERQYLINKYQLPFDDLSEECREAFRKRYGESYL